MANPTTDRSTAHSPSWRPHRWRFGAVIAFGKFVFQLPPAAPGPEVDAVTLRESAWRLQEQRVALRPDQCSTAQQLSQMVGIQRFREMMIEARIVRPRLVPILTPTRDRDQRELSI